MGAAAARLAARLLLLVTVLASLQGKGVEAQSGGEGRSSKGGDDGSDDDEVSALAPPIEPNGDGGGSSTTAAVEPERDASTWAIPVITFLSVLAVAIVAYIYHTRRMNMTREEGLLTQERIDQRLQDRERESGSTGDAATVTATVPGTTPAAGPTHRPLGFVNSDLSDENMMSLSVPLISGQVSPLPQSPLPASANPEAQPFPSFRRNYSAKQGLALPQSPAPHTPLSGMCGSTAYGAPRYPQGGQPSSPTRPRPRGADARGSPPTQLPLAAANKSLPVIPTHIANAFERRAASPPRPPARVKAPTVICDSPDPI